MGRSIATDLQLEPNFPNFWSKYLEPPKFEVLSVDFRQKNKHLELVWLCLLQNVSQSLYVNKHISYIYIYIYIHLNSAILYIKINVFVKVRAINKCVCVHACMYGCEQSFE